MRHQIGSRVRVARRKATVRYIGPVTGQTGTWLGLEWDDPSRGKHDGSVNGVQYFSCQSAATAGSFVRAEKVHDGLGLLEALRLRYTNQQAETVVQEAPEAAAGASSRVSFVFVGEDSVTARQSKLDQLVRARLVDAMVDRLEPPADLAAALPQLQELDLTANLLHTWSFVVDLCTSLPQLSALNLSSNHLQLLSSAPQLTGLRRLVLNECGVTWPQVFELQSSLPWLQELHLAKNNIASLDVPGTTSSSSSSSGPPAASASERVLAMATATPACSEQAATKVLPAALAGLAVEDRQQLGDQGAPAAGASSSLPCSSSAVGSAAAPSAAQQAADGAINSRAAQAGTAASTGAAAAAAPDGCSGWAVLGPSGDPVGLLPGFKHLQVLGLEDNALSSWSEVCRLAGLPALTRLHLSGNPLPEVVYPQLTLSAGTAATAAAVAAQPSAAGDGGSNGCTAAAAAGQGCQQAVPTSSTTPVAGGAPAAAAATAPAAFSRLEALLLGSTQVSSWSSVDALDRFPVLQELRLSGTPLLAAAGPHSSRRYEVIARIHGLTLLNGADVKPRERRDCELCYVHTVLTDAAAAQQQQAGGGEALLAQHPRAKLLQEKYGVASVTATAAAARAGSTLSTTTCELVLTCGARSSKKKLPRSTTVAALKLLCSRLFKIPANSQRLLLHTENERGSAEALDGDDTRALAYYDIVDGCRLEVKEEAPEERQAAAAEEAARQQAALQQRAQQQLVQGDRLRSVAACQ